MKILQFPLARVALTFILGIIFYQKYQPEPFLVFISLLIGILFLLFFHFLSKKKPIYQFIFGTLTLLISFNIGISTCLFHKETLRQNHYLNQIEDDSFHEIKLVVHEKLKSTPKNSRYVSVIHTIDNRQSFGKIILNIRKPNQIEDFPIGSHVKVTGSIYKSKNPFNPNQFDYGKYLENQEIYAQVYIDEKQMTIGKFESTLWSGFSNFRTKIIQNLKTSRFKTEELNIMIAFLLGQQQDISPEVLKDYQLAGAVHILSVSGLHVGFILLFVTFLLKPMANTKRNAVIKLIIILLSLWSYGILAGLAPSVVRSVTMFSFVAVGNHFRRTVNNFHTLLVSMLLILLWKPSFLFDIGFQLSYLALFFILWLQPLLSEIWQPKYKITQYIWDIVTVSFAAQIGTMPLSLYYFHQFPGLFFVTNIIVLPLLGIIMIVGLIAIITACFGKVSFLVVKPLEFLIELQNHIINWIASFEDFVLSNISFTTAMLWVSYVMIIAIIVWLKKPEFKRLSIALLSTIALQIVYIDTKFKTNNVKELIVFNTKKSTIITQRQNRFVTVYSNDSILNSLESNLSIQSYLVGNFCEAKEKKKLQNVFYFKNKRIMLIDSYAVYSEKIKPDVLIITHSPKLNFERLLTVYKPKEIVVDGSNFKSYVRLWESTCRKEKIPFHYTNEKGFYKI
ncbi:ComEC/Rec2 family competence protein [Flavobacterium sp. 102]|uniref:ComEC/Rec2 family competence protein n=1 Tax=Flavobacterium sp. 102 TaxID=2135623 RepID=UPI000EAE8E94|nr:ComEC/Rec2 family competence protein [Flavobacterium sp. 102]RKS01518.1 competence protein ComEC [Flavobacterium sp. 102]